MAGRYADAIADEHTKEEPQADGSFMEMPEENGLSLTMFYAVSYRKDGAVKNVMNIPNSALTDEDVAKTARALPARKKMADSYWVAVYQHVSRADFDVLVWMDNPVMTRNMMTLLIANPLAAIWSSSQLLDFLGYEAWGTKIIDGIETLLMEKISLTPDQGGSAGTSE